ncbi:hypothetical protein BH10CYA1_BH10CYA1_18210 [soil metagenome]
MSTLLGIVVAACCAGIVVCVLYRPHSAAVWTEKVMTATLVCGVMAGLAIGLLLQFSADMLVAIILICGLIPTAIEFASFYIRSREATDLIDQALEVENFLLAWLDNSHGVVTVEMLRAASNSAIARHILAHIDDVGHLVSSDMYVTPGSQHVTVIELFEIVRTDITGDSERQAYHVRVNQKYAGWYRMSS